MGFPESYQTGFKQFYVFDRLDNRQIRYVCANDVAASVKPGDPFPYGSILVFESWRAKQDPGGALVKDTSGHLIRETLTTVFVMRKEKGFGEDYQGLRNGEWEYVAYRPDKSVQTPPQNSASCAACHLAATAKKDFVFHPELFFTKERYAQTPSVGSNEVAMSSVAFYPNNLTVKVGTTIKWTNSALDGIDHTATATNNAFDSGILKPGAGHTVTLTAPGTYPYFCALHPDQMRGTIRVTD